MSAARHGERYWCVRTPLSTDGTAFFHADVVKVDDSGNLLLYGHTKGEWPASPDAGVIVASFAAGFWAAFYLADLETGACSAAAHWPEATSQGEVS